MFGYILPDKPNLYMKDYALYRGFYCGLCHEIGHCQGQCMRLGVNYDVTFLSILVHGLWEETPPMAKKACILNPVRKKMVVLGERQRTMAYLNTLLLDYKCRDDVADGERGKRVLRALMARRTKQAAKQLPEVAALLQQAAAKQGEVEATRPTSWRIAAEPFANCIQDILPHLCGEKYTPSIGNVGYALGLYVYLLDAIDDYDEDIKKGQYNPLYAAYGLPDKGALVAAMGDQLQDDLQEVVADIKDNYRKVAIFATEGIVTNTLWIGLMARARQVLKETKKCQKLHTKF